MTPRSPQISWGTVHAKDRRIPYRNSNPWTSLTPLPIHNMHTLEEEKIAVPTENGDFFFFQSTPT